VLREVDFAKAPRLMVGDFRAVDFFGDGSFYLLDTPGHTIGHLGGLVRTTKSPDTFIFMGGDLCHHGGEIRPSAHLPVPDEVHLPSSTDVLRARRSTCLGGELFRQLNIKRGRAEDQPIFDPLAEDLPAAMKTIRETQVADAQDGVFFIFAHDTSIRSVVDLFPLPANDWLKRGWREKAQWAFLADLVPALEK
jgi:glyoxylase-like metal-dependent hydrolase (beta-lactamase superfamily II)